MGNYRFKLSDMMPNAWFYKLRDMGRARKQSTPHSRKKKQSPPASATQPSKAKPPNQSNNPRKSYYFTRELNSSDRIYNSPISQTHQKVADTTNFPEPPRKSSKQRSKRRTSRTSPKVVVTTSSSVSSGCNCRNTLESVCNKSDSPVEYSSSSPFDSSAESEFPEPEFRTDRVLPTESFDEMVSRSHNSYCGSRVKSNTSDDIIIDVDKNSIARKHENLDGYDSFLELELLPIITKPEKFNDLLSDAKKKETKARNRVATYEEQRNRGKTEECSVSIKEQRNTSVRRFSVSSSPGVKLRINSPRFGSRKTHTHGRKSLLSTNVSGSRRSLSDSFAIVKSSFNPQRDFRESMVEMIVKNNIRSTKDLEDLLACYLSLNSDEYHDLIIKVFKQIWFDLTDNQWQ